MDWNLHILLPLLLVPAKIIGVSFRKLGIPAVVGEIVAGIILGPALFGLIPPSGPEADNGFLIFEEFAQIGLCVLLFRIGLETDLRDFLRVWRPATSVAILGMVFPFIFGFGAGIVLGWTYSVAAFVGATLTATSIGVTASVLEEVDAQTSKEGKIMLGAAVLDDVFGLVLLAAMVAMAVPGESVAGSVSRSLIQALGFIFAGLLLGPWIVRVFMVVNKWSGKPAILLVFSFAYLLLMAWTAHAIGLAMIIGAYAAGLAFGGHPEHEKLNQDLRPIIDLITPLFFILIGASIEFTGFNPMTPTGRVAWIIFGILFATAVAGKLLSPIFLKGKINRMAIGSGMMPRGEVGFVFAQMGLSVGLFELRYYSVLTLVLVATTILGPLMLRLVWPRHQRYESILADPK